MIRSFAFTTQGKLHSKDIETFLMPTLLADTNLFLWLDLEKPTAEESKLVLEDIFHFHQLSIEDCVSVSPSPKVEEYVPKDEDKFAPYLFMVIHAVDYSRKDGVFATKELNFFLGKNFLVTFHEVPLRSVQQTEERCLKSSVHIARAPDRVAHTLLDGIVENYKPALDELAAVTAEAGFELVQRLTAQPKYVQAGAAWIDPRVAAHVAALADPVTGLARDINPTGLPWQEPDEATESLGRIDLHSTIDTEGRRTEARSDLGNAFGDWESIRDRVGELAARVPERVDSDVAAALRSAERDPAGCSDAQYFALATADGPALDAVAALADSLRKDAVGDDVTFVINRNINFTNICYTGCRFCAFAQRKGDADAFSLTTSEVADRAWEAHVAGATEVCMQGGIDPELPVTGYADLVRAVKARVPSMHVHAFSPMEIASGATKSGMGIREWLISLREAGLDTIPGTAAEILDDEVRWVLTKGKLPTSLWVDIVSTAHEIGLRSSSTMMYGHVDTPSHWVAHINVLRAIQDRTGGFTEFVPLPFVHQSSPLYLAGAARPGPTHRDNRAVHALARIMLHGRIPHIQTSWVKLGAQRSQVMLTGGANDLGGTLMEETISRMAGSQHGSAKSAAELVAIAEGIGRPARQRTTTYGKRAA